MSQYHHELELALKQIMLLFWKFFPFFISWKGKTLTFEGVVILFGLTNHKLSYVSSLKGKDFAHRRIGVWEFGGL